MTAEEYTDAIQKLNDQLKPSRSSKVDTALLATGVLLVPLALWGAWHGCQTKKRKRLMKKAIDEFNAVNPGLWMRWNRRPQSFLSIEKREDVTNATMQVEMLPEATAEAMHVEPPQQLDNSNDDDGFKTNTVV